MIINWSSPLTHTPVPHICVSELCQHCFPYLGWYLIDIFQCNAKIAHHNLHSMCRRTTTRPSTLRRWYDIAIITIQPGLNAELKKTTFRNRSRLHEYFTSRNRAIKGLRRPATVLWMCRLNNKMTRREEHSSRQPYVKFVVPVTYWETAIHCFWSSTPKYLQNNHCHKLRCTDGMRENQMF